MARSSWLAITGLCTNVLALVALGYLGSACFPSKDTKDSIGDEIRSQRQGRTSETDTTQQETQFEHIADAFISPDVEGIDDFGAYAESLPTAEADKLKQSEYMIGTVRVNVIAIESSGAKDPNTEDWDPAKLRQAGEEIAEALRWWEDLDNTVELSFDYDTGAPPVHETQYEPINRPHSDENLWINEIMGDLGYGGFTTHGRVREYNEDKRQEYGTDWVFTIFLVNAEKDRDHKFTDEYFAYAYLQGPFTVMTVPSNGYGAGDLSAVAAHEIGHLFGALDQYATAKQKCDEHAGYLDIEHNNSEYRSEGRADDACTLDAGSIMRGQTWPFSRRQIDVTARGQIGWKDSDDNGRLDPVDGTFSISLNPDPRDTRRTVAPGTRITGRVTANGFRSPRRGTTSIIKLSGMNLLDAQCNGGKTEIVAPDDGAWDEADESFSFVYPEGIPQNRFAIVAYGSFGNKSGSDSFCEGEDEDQEGGPF